MDVDDSENHTLDGVLVFKPTEKSTCIGCAIHKEYLLGRSTPAPPCSKGARKDGRNGIWVYR